jgi:hypothetical protein
METAMRDTDWRPSACPSCGTTRVAAERPVCYNRNCKSYKSNSTSRDERSKIMKQEQRYVCTDATGCFKGIVTDLTELYHNKDYDRENDRIYELGREVKLKMTLNIEPAQPVYRNLEDAIKNSKL